MPSDIRSFFGGKVPPPVPKKESEEKTNGSAKKRGRPSKRVIESDDDEEEAPPKKSTPKKATPKKSAKKEPSPEGEATTTSEFFGSKNKPKRSEVVKKAPAQTTPKKAAAKQNGTTKTPPSKPTANGRSSARKTKPVSYAEDKIDETLLDDNDLGDGDIFAVDLKPNGRKGGDDYVEEDEDDIPLVKPKRVAESKGQQNSIKKDEDFAPEEDDVDMKDANPEDNFVVPDDDEAIAVDKPSKTKKHVAPKSAKRKSEELEEDEDEDDEPPKKGRGKPKATPTKSPAKKKAKKEDVPESAAMQEILDSIPTVRPPTPPPPSGEPRKFNFAASGANAGPPPAQGSKEIPQGAENCLAGLNFVFTGLLDTLQREEGQNLVKRYGGKVTGAPSSKTSFVVLGSDAGPKKLETIKKFGLKTINEDGLFELLRRLPANGGDSKAAAKYAEKQEEEEKKIKEMAAEMEKEQRRAGGAGGAGAAGTTPAKGKSAPRPSDSQLWTVKYAPSGLGQICGNKTAVEKLQRWLRMFPKNQQKGFKLAGSDGSGIYRAVIIHGPPGIGKTTAAHLVAKLEGYDVVESNASDTRSKKLVEQGLKGVLSTTSLLGYFAGEGSKVEASKKKLVLIMDEVDGMSAGDRGGVGALAAVCKKTQIPMILICNDRKLPKMKPFDYVTYDLPFRRPTTDQIRSRIMTIAYREGLKMPKNVIDALIEGSNADIRQIVNMISTAKLDATAMDYDAGKGMSKAWEKHIILKPWDIVSKILGGGMFAASSKATLNDKIELYFNDHEFSYLMLQENYLGTNPIAISGYSGKEKQLKALEQAEKAAESISDGDLVDRMIHGSQQQWSLMPTHAVFSFVRPASYVSGSMAGNQTRFTSWLGKNSAQGKLIRYVKEIQGHMRLRTSADRHEIRQQYIPTLWKQLVKRLELEGRDAAEAVIELMDSYFLTKEDFDAIRELGVGPMAEEKLDISSQAKATFTRLYNQQSHPLPFMKASSVQQPKKLSKEKPDLEEAIDESDDGEEVVDDVDAKKEEEEDVDLSKDKYVKQPKKKKAAPQASGKGSKKRKAADDDDEEEEEAKPKKGKGGAKK